MRSKKLWLIIKAVLILLLTLLILSMPAKDSSRNLLRVVMLIIFVASFINDLIKYKKAKD